MSHSVRSRFGRRLSAVAFLAVLTALPALCPAAETVDPYGNCCVAKVTMADVAAWDVVCGSCAANPGVYRITQPDPEKLVFTGPGGVSAASRYEAAQAVCKCPSQTKRRAWEKQMRSFDGQ